MDSFALMMLAYKSTFTDPNDTVKSSTLMKKNSTTPASICRSMGSCWLHHHFNTTMC